MSAESSEEIDPAAGKELAEGAANEGGSNLDTIATWVEHHVIEILCKSVCSKAETFPYFWSVVFVFLHVLLTF